jgi:predicted tellurium resistance membrane protein TerC
MDIVFSIDNILAVVAMTSNFVIVFIGVSLGIISMRFVAQVFVKLLERYPSLEKSAYILIAVLGLRLIIDGSFQVLKLTELSEALASSTVGVVFTLITLAIFLYPIAVGKLKGANQS